MVDMAKLVDAIGCDPIEHNARAGSNPVIHPMDA